MKEEEEMIPDQVHIHKLKLHVQPSSLKWLQHVGNGNNDSSISKSSFRVITQTRISWCLS
jgi:hypothetical protein